MTRKVFGSMMLVILLALAASAAAEEDNTSYGTDPERPDDAAWVEDCPPDMMCAAAVEDDPDSDPTRGPEDCEFCRYHQDEDCIYCLTGPLPDDDTTWGTDCPPGVFCMVNGETDDPDDAGWVDCDGEVCAYDRPGEPEPALETGEASAVGVVLAGMIGLLGMAIAGRRR